MHKCVLVKSLLPTRDKGRAVVALTLVHPPHRQKGATMRTMTTAFANSLAMVFTALPAHAAEEDDWKFELTPYIWAVGLKGDVTVKGREGSVDKSFSDLIKY